MNTRIAVPLSKEAYDAISEIAKINGMSRGKFVAEALEGVIPSFLRIASAYRAAQALDEDEMGAVSDVFKRAEEHLMASLTDADRALLEVELERGRAPQAEGEAGARSRSDPPATNRGVPKFSSGGSA
uniref:Uncharacterized protein n=1 Tax=uncultured prokaryote TaxID=198431 RepID=A0A0H5Q548_9ZZZZ|nr:hypothetical protein [uncultured prokaryote]